MKCPFCTGPLIPLGQAVVETGAGDFYGTEFCCSECGSRATDMCDAAPVRTPRLLTLSLAL